MKWKLKIEKPNLLKGHEPIVSWKVKNEELKVKKEGVFSVHAEGIMNLEQSEKKAID